MCCLISDQHDSIPWGKTHIKHNLQHNANGRPSNQTNVESKDGRMGRRKEEEEGRRHGGGHRVVLCWALSRARAVNGLDSRPWKGGPQWHDEHLDEGFCPLCPASSAQVGVFRLLSVGPVIFQAPLAQSRRPSPQPQSGPHLRDPNHGASSANHARLVSE